MQSNRLISRVWATCTVLAIVAFVVSNSRAIEVGNGLSQEKDPAAAGADAAKQAKAALGDVDVKLVLVFNGPAVKDRDALLGGVASVFDPSVTYGCPGYNPLTQAGNAGDVAVLAIGGDVQVATAIAPVEGGDGHAACGKQIGEALLDASKAKAAGRVLLLFGNCHVPKDNDLVLGACSVLGEKFPVVGGASLGGGVYYEGKVVGGNNVGLLLSGDFTCGFAMKKDMTPEGLIASAGDSCKQAIGDGGDKLALMLVFDCGGRRGAMGANLPKELEAIKAAVGDAPIFGFYGSGEIGHNDNDSPSRGDGYHISACAIINK